jgi:hypothetical protein
VPRDPDTIQREIEQARDALADSLDELSERAHPKHLVEAGRRACGTAWPTRGSATA